MTGRWVMADGLARYVPTTHTGDCHAACDGRTWTTDLALAMGGWVKCWCGCHEDAS